MPCSRSAPAEIVNACTTELDEQFAEPGRLRRRLSVEMSEDRKKIAVPVDEGIVAFLAGVFAGPEPL
jgi:hypothetical protein